MVNNFFHEETKHFNKFEIGSAMNRSGSAVQSGSAMNRSGSLRSYLSLKLFDTAVS